jgi:hypothetical protein
VSIRFHIRRPIGATSRRFRQAAPANTELHLRQRKGSLIISDVTDNVALREELVQV